MIDARENGEAMKILTECGYPEDRGGGLEGVLAQARADTFRDIAGAVPDPRLAEIFQLKYDYHNAKVILKAQAVGADPERLLLAGGRYDPRGPICFWTEAAIRRWNDWPRRWAAPSSWAMSG